MKIMILASILFLNISFLFAQKQTILVPYRVADKWGYSDTLGRIIIQPNYTEAGIFDYDKTILRSRGAALVKLNGQLMAIDEKGTVVVPPKYEAITINHTENGLAFIVQDKKGNMGIYQNGKKLIPCMYSHITPEINDSYIVEKNDLLGLINTQGKLIVPIMFNDIKPEFLDNKNLIQWKATKNNIIKEFTDKKISPRNYDPPFGFALDKVFSKEGIQRKLDTLKTLYSVDKVDVRDDYAIFEKGNQTGIIFLEDKTTNPVFLPKSYDLQQFYFLPSYSSGRARYNAKILMVAKQNNFYGIITEKEQVIVPFEYDLIIEAEGLYFLQKNNKLGFFILHTHYPVIPPKYDEFINNYSIPVNAKWSFGLYEVRIGQKKGFVGENGMEFFKD